MIKEEENVGFGPDGDGRNPWEWDTRYPPEAWKHILIEKIYLIGLLGLVSILIYLLWSGNLNNLLGLTTEKYATFQKCGYGVLGGLLGGTLFSLKWLYHSVAKNKWHIDRRIWRFSTPLIGGASAFVFYILVSSSIFVIFDPAALKSPRASVGFGFLVGYFSDMAMGKLSELAETIFGSNTYRQKKQQEILNKTHKGISQ